MKKFFPLLLFLLLILSACTGADNVASKKAIDDIDGSNNDLAASDDGWLTGDDDIPLGGVLDVSETYLDFGTVYIFETPRLFSTRYIHVNNLGSAPLTYTTSTLMNDFYFDADNTTCGINGGTLPAVSSCVYAINFKPLSVYEPSGTFRIASGNTGKLIRITGRGEIIQRGTINANYRDIFFSTTVLGSSSDITVTAKNTGHLNVKFDQQLPRNSAFKKTGGTCSASQILKPGETCTIIMRFAPTSVGSFTDRLILTSRDPRNGDIQFIITLNGKGINDGIVSVSSDNLSFGLVRVGEFKEKNITIRNSGQLTVKFKTTFPEGFFDAGSTCNVTTFEALKPNTSCDIKIRFSPDRVIVYTDYLRIITNKGIRTQVNMTAAGYIDEPLLVQPNDLIFPPTLVGANSLIRKLLLTNTARLPIKIDTEISPNFNSIAASTCAANDMILQPDESCEISLIFKPTEWLAYEGTATFTHKLNIDGTVTATLHGQGVTEGVLTATPLALNFGRVQDGTSSTVRSVNVTNTGGRQFSFTTRIAAPFFIQPSSTCSRLATILLPGDSCRFDIIFTPPDRTLFNDTLEMMYNGKTAVVTLAGAGAAPPDITVAPLDLAFGDVIVGAESALQTTTVTSVGGADAIVSYTVPTGYIERGGTCSQGIILPTGSSCIISLAFAPINNITYNSNLIITSSGKVINVALTGTGFRLGELTANPPALAFGNVLITTSSLPQTVQLRNTGDRPVIFQINMPTDFTINATSTCGAAAPYTLNQGATCNLVVQFSPTQNIAYNANIAFVYNTGGGINVAVTGRGTRPGDLVITPPSLNYNNVVAGKTVTLSTTYENKGEATLTVETVFPTAITLFTRNPASTCQPVHVLAPGDKCILSVDFSTTNIATITSSINLTVTDALGTTNRTIPLHAVSVAPGSIVVTPDQLTFPATPVRGTSAGQQITVRNTGGSPATVTATITPSFVFTTSTCAMPVFTLQAGTQCVITIVFKPQEEGLNEGYARFAYDATSTDIIVRGTGTGATIVIAPNPLEFGEVAINRPSKTMSLTITNTSTTIDFEYTFTLPRNVEFMNAGVDTACFETNVLSPGGSCTLAVRLNLTEVKNYNIVIQVFNTVTGQPLDTPMVLTATAIHPMVLSLSPTTMVFGNVQINTVSEQTITIKNIGGRRGKFNRGFAEGYTFDTTGVTSTCNALSDTLDVNQSCTYIIRFAPLALNAYNSVINFSAEGVFYPLVVQGTGIARTRSLALSRSSIEFLDTPVGYTKSRDVAVTNISDKDINFKIHVPIDFDMDNNSTCAKYTSLRPDETCNIIINFMSDELAEFNDDMSLNYDNESININLSARNKKHGYVKYLSDLIDINSKLLITADNDTLFIYNNELGSLYKYDLRFNLYAPLTTLEPFNNAAKMSIKNNELFIFYDNSSKYYQYNIADNTTKKSEFTTPNILRFDNSTVLLNKDNILYLMSNDNATNIFRFDEVAGKFINIKTERNSRSTTNQKDVLLKAVTLGKGINEHKIFTPSGKVFFINKFLRFEKTKILKSVDSKDMKIDNVTIDDTLYKLSTDDIESVYYDGSIFIIDKLGKLSLIIQ